MHFPLKDASIHVWLRTKEKNSDLTKAHLQCLETNQMKGHCQTREAFQSFHVRFDKSFICTSRKLSLSFSRHACSLIICRSLCLSLHIYVSFIFFILNVINKLQMDVHVAQNRERMKQNNKNKNNSMQQHNYLY